MSLETAGLSFDELKDIHKKMIGLIDRRRLTLRSKGMEDPNKTDYNVSDLRHVSEVYQEIGFMVDHVNRLEYFIAMMDCDENEILDKERSEKLLASLPEFEESDDN